MASMISQTPPEKEDKGVGREMASMIPQIPAEDSEKDAGTTPDMASIISQTPAEDEEKDATGSDTESWTILDGTENPYNWTKGRKWLITIIFCLNNFIVSVGASIFTPGIGLIAHDFNVSIVVATLGLSCYVLGFSMGPLVFAPMSEVYGRRIVYIPTWILFILFQIGCALAPNITTLVICRLFVGAFGSPALTVAAGIMSDIWRPNELGPPLGLFTMAAFLGPVAGPIAGGFITEYIPTSEPWRWSFWIPFIVSCVLCLNWTWLPETYAPTLLEQKAKAANRPPSQGTKSHGAVFRLAVWRPLHMLVFEPVVLLVSLYISFLIGILYLYFGAYPLVFAGRYGFGAGFSGLAFIGIGVGVVLSFVTAGYANTVYIRLKEGQGKGEGDAYPEGRLPLAIAAAGLVPGSIFWFAWSGREGVHWIVPVVSGVPFGWSMVVLFISLISFLAEGYLEYSASVIAANTVLRSLFAMAFPLFGRAMYISLTPEWAGSLLGFISVLFVPIPFLFYKYGWWLRKNSRYPTKQELAQREQARVGADQV